MNTFNKKQYRWLIVVIELFFCFSITASDDDHLKYEFSESYPEYNYLNFTGILSDASMNEVNKSLNDNIDIMSANTSESDDVGIGEGRPHVPVPIGNGFFIMLIMSGFYIIYITSRQKNGEE